MNKWRLTKQAEQSLFNIANWTVENFGKDQAYVYRDSLTGCINRLASNKPPYRKPCSQLLQGNIESNNLFYYLEGKHYIVYRESKTSIDILEFFHERCDLPFHINKLSKE